METRNETQKDKARFFVFTAPGEGKPDAFGEGWLGCYVFCKFKMGPALMPVNQDGTLPAGAVLYLTARRANKVADRLPGIHNQVGRLGGLGELADAMRAATRVYCADEIKDNPAARTMAAGFLYMKEAAFASRAGVTMHTADFWEIFKRCGADKYVATPGEPAPIYPGWAGDLCGRE